MKNFYKSFLLLLFFGLILGFIYPLFVFLISKVVFNKEANGSLIKVNEKIIGSKLLGQKFVSDKYFHSRPSFGDYYGIDFSATNLSQTQTVFFQMIQKNAQDYRKTNLLNEDTFLPNDSVTSSASGLDPHISLENASLQVKRIAKARNVKEADINNIVQNHLEKQMHFSTPIINVLLLNIDLDEKYK